MPVLVRLVHCAVFLRAANFLVIGVVAIIFFIRSRNKSRDADKVAETVEKDVNVEDTEPVETEEQK